MPEEISEPEEEASARASPRAATAASLRSVGSYPPGPPPFSPPTLRLRRTVDEPGGPQLPRFARWAATPLDPLRSPPRRSASGGPSTSQGVRSCLASLGGLLPPWPPSVLLPDAPPPADRRRARGSAAASLRSVGCYPPGPPPFSSPTLRLRRTVDEPGGPQLPRFARCAATPLAPLRSPPRRSASGGPSTSQEVRSCLSSLGGLRPPRTPSVLLPDAPPPADRRRARGSAAASLRSVGCYPPGPP